MSNLKLKEILKNDYVKTIIFLAIMILSVMGFWFGLKAVLKTEYPLLAVASGSMVPTLNVGDLIVASNPCVPHPRQNQFPASQLLFEIVYRKVAHP